ncbi:MAG: RNA polymerase sigma factor [Phycisphaerales bacterium]
MRAARDGDRDAIGDLYRQFAPMTHAILLSRVGPHEAEDLVQEVFLIAMRRLHRLRKADSFGPWVATIARRQAASHWRRRRWIPRLDQSSMVADPAQDRVQALEALAAIRSLPESYRETLLMRLVARMSGPEIAMRTGMTPGSVRVNLHRGMKLLRERLGVEDDSNG